MSKPKPKCPECERVANLIEEEFCRSYGKVSYARCKELMNARREGRIDYTTLVQRLGTTSEEFDAKLNKAIRKIVK